MGRTGKPILEKKARIMKKCRKQSGPLTEDIAGGKEFRQKYLKEFEHAEKTYKEEEKKFEKVYKKWLKNFGVSLAKSGLCGATALYLWGGICCPYHDLQAYASCFAVFGLYLCWENPPPDPPTTLLERYVLDQKHRNCWVPKVPENIEIKALLQAVKKGDIEKVKAFLTSPKVGNNSNIQD